jgi:hypothetical protein
VQDLGPDGYSLANYFDYSSGRWKYYRCHAEGHNTLVINPGSGEDQNRLARPNLYKQALNVPSPFVVSDLTPVYGVRSVRRGIKLLQISAQVSKPQSLAALNTRG